MCLEKLNSLDDLELDLESGDSFDNTQQICSIKMKDFIMTCK